MKRQRFRLGNVLRHYELQRQRAEQDLMLATRVLNEIDEAIAGLEAEITLLAELAGPNAAGVLTAAGWMAYCKKSEHLGQSLAAARVRRQRQADVVVRCDEQRRRWAVAEETLLSLRRQIEAANETEETKAAQLQLQQAILSRWLGVAAEQAPEM